MMLDVRHHFPLLRNQPELCYLDSAATTQKPDYVIRSIVDFLENKNANVHRGVHSLNDASDNAYQTAREQVARFIGAKPHEVIFTQNATAAINIVSRGFSSIPHRNLTRITNIEHNSNYLPWIKYGPVTFFDPQKACVWDHKNLDHLRLVAMTHLSNVLGAVTPVRQVAHMTHAYNMPFLIDAAQSVGHMPISVKELGCDFMAFSGHKMLALTGVGVLYIEEHMHDKMRPVFLGGGTINTLDLNQYDWTKLPNGYEAGTPPIVEAISLAAAINYLESIGMQQITMHIADLTCYCVNQLIQIGIMPIGKTKKHGLVSFNLDNIHPHDVAFELDKLQIAVRAGHHCAHLCNQTYKIKGSVRASFHIYNTKADVDRLVEGLKHIRHTFPHR